MEKDSFKIAVLSGKGGVGKSLLASSLAILFSENGFRGKEESLLAVDADADAPNLDIWLGGVEKWDKIIPVFASEKPVIDYQKCDGCGLCAKHCKFGAIKMINGRPVINPMLCEGCGVCEQVCPRKAIHLEPVQNGEIRIKDFSDNSRILISSFLLPGEASSGRIVDELLKKAEEFVSPLAFIDTAPGTGCPVKAVLRKSHAVIAIAEPSVASFSDLKKVLEVVSFFKLPYWIVLNKIGINPSLEKKMRAWAGEKLLGEITYDSKIFQAVSHFTPIVKTKLKAKKEIEEIYSQLRKKIFPLIEI